MKTELRIVAPAFVYTHSISSGRADEIPRNGSKLPEVVTSHRRYIIGARPQWETMSQELFNSIVIPLSTVRLLEQKVSALQRSKDRIVNNSTSCGYEYPLFCLTIFNRRHTRFLISGFFSNILLCDYWSGRCPTFRGEVKMELLTILYLASSRTVQFVLQYFFDV